MALSQQTERAPICERADAQRLKISPRIPRFSYLDIGRDYCVRTVVDALSVDGKAKLDHANIGVKLCDAVTVIEASTRVSPLGSDEQGFDVLVEFGSIG
jgi:hypothetical protein